MNTANKLTMVRVVLIPVLLILLYLDFEYSNYIALAIYVIATLTDVADGFIARTRNQITDFGKFMDPLADKILSLTALLWFIEVGLIPAWLVLIVITREFMVTGMRLVAVAKDRVIAASVFGKIKTLITNLCIIALFFPLELWMIILCWILIGVASIVSGVEYFIKNKDVMKMDM